MLKFLLGFAIGLGLIGSVAAWWLLSNGNSSNAPWVINQEILDKVSAKDRAALLQGRVDIEFPDELKETAKEGKFTKLRLFYIPNAYSSKPPFHNMAVPLSLDPKNKFIGRFPLLNQAFNESLPTYEGYFQLTACHQSDADSEPCAEDIKDWPRFFRGRTYFKAETKNTKGAELDFGTIPMNIYFDGKDSCKDNPILKRKIVATDSYRQKFPSDNFNFYVTVHLGAGARISGDRISGGDGRPLMIQKVNLKDPLVLDFSNDLVMRQLKSFAMMLTACPKSQPEEACMKQLKNVSGYNEDGFLGQSEGSNLIRLVQDNLRTITCTKEERSLYANWFQPIDARHGLFKLSEGMPKGLIDGFLFY